jgi:ABC-type bacteriocin/lantibiotic exporter with double-glycine peptidase domain
VTRSSRWRSRAPVRPDPPPLRGGERQAAWALLHVDAVNTVRGVAWRQLLRTTFQNAIGGARTALVMYLGARLALDRAGFSTGMLIAFLPLLQTSSDRVNGLAARIREFRMLRLRLDRLADIVCAAPECEQAKVAPASAVRSRSGRKSAYRILGAEVSSL